ncbi:anaphase-promoting complex subunit Cdc16p [Trichomonascus vanleenenianus]|uniref:anaphase promoting complex subunit CDC16 n=1 Tax=Trichomonascus vanleenenianus TaxID=2268995 RepID=UPI003ECA5348
MDAVITPLTKSSGALSSAPLSQVDKLRIWRQDALVQHHYETAEHIGDKILALTNDPNDAFWLAQVHYCSGNYTRAHQLLTSRGEIDQSPACKHLTALSLTKMNKWDKALELIGDTTPREALSGQASSNSLFSPASGSSTAARRTRRRGGGRTTAAQAGEDANGIKIEAAIAFLRGQIFTYQNNFDRAKECYQEAVQIDGKCFEAFNQLIKNSLLTPDEEWEFLKSINFEGSCGPDNAELTKALYTVRLGKYTHLQSYLEADTVLKDDYGLADNSDVLLSKADMLFVQCKFRDCLELCERILDKDKFKFAAYPNYLACLHELGARNKLFLLAHELADSHPAEPVSWLAVGVYYLTIGKIAEARRYFSKASMMNPYFGQAWIGFAHTFAVEGEHEQAISAYSTAARLFPGTHLPSLFLGMQHLHLNNLTLAEEYLSSSYAICSADPLLLNEMGVVFYHKNELKTAETYFHEALQAAESLNSDPRAWLSIRANLGHVYRRLEKHDMSLSYFEEILRISPRDANIHSAMGLVNLQAGRLFVAIENFHEALSIAPNDPVASELLQRALEEHTKEGLNFDEDEFEFDFEQHPEYRGMFGSPATGNDSGFRIHESESPVYNDHDDSHMEIESD